MRGRKEFVFNVYSSITKILQTNSKGFYPHGYYRRGK